MTAADFDVRIWYENARPGQLEKAISISEYLDAGAWTKVVSVFGPPVFDGGGLVVNRCRGLDPAIDIVLSPISNVDGRMMPYYDKEGCQGPISGFSWSGAS